MVKDQKTAKHGEKPAAARPQPANDVRSAMKLPSHRQSKAQLRRLVSGTARTKNLLVSIRVP